MKMLQIASHSRQLACPTTRSLRRHPQLRSSISAPGVQAGVSSEGQGRVDAQNVTLSWIERP